VEQDPSPLLSTSPGSISLESTAGSSDDFTVSSNIDWTVSDDAAWLSVSPESGSGNGTVTVTADTENTSDADRTATVTVSGDGLAETVTVTQAGSTPELSAEPGTLTIASAAGSNGNITLTSNTSWSASDNANWLAIDPTSGSDNGSIVATASSENTSASDRSAIVTIIGGGLTETVIVTQEANSTGIFAVSPGKAGISVYPNPASGSIWLKSAEDLLIGTELRLYDQTGKLLMSRTIDRLLRNESHEIDITQLDAGVYILRISSPDSIAVIKLFKL